MKVKTKIKTYETMAPGRVKLWFDEESYICDKEDSKALELEVAKVLYPKKYGKPETA